MFQQMLNASKAVLLRPDVATFEEHERNSLGWATLYVAIGAIITAILGAIGHVIQQPFLEQQYADLAEQFEALEQQLGRPIPLANILAPQDPVIPIFVNVIGTLIGFFIFLGVIYLLGRAFGGSGAFGELAYDVALYWVPISVLSAFVNMFSISVLACLTAPIAIVLAVYNLYLTFLSVRAGMNLAGDRALMVILTPVLVVILLCCGLFALVATLGSGANGG